ncbi:LytTR family DNA-binding domain-containing protein [Spirosoma luteolum]
MSLLNQPYPFEDRLRYQLGRAALIGLFVGLFLLAFQPFGISHWQTAGKAVKVMGFGLVTFVVTSLVFVGMPRLWPGQFTDRRWTVGREILLITVNVLLIAVANRFYLETLLRLDGYPTSGMSWLSTVLITALVGVFPVTGTVLLSYIGRLKKYSQAAATLAVPTHGPITTGTPTNDPAGSPVPNDLPARLTLVADNGKDQVDMVPTDLLAVESSDNYCTVLFDRQGQLGRMLLRSSLSRLQGQIDAQRLPDNRQPYVRCHRSYVVNLDRVERVTGNAQGYKLHLLDSQLVVPVSRQYNDTLVADLKRL